MTITDPLHDAVRRRAAALAAINAPSSGDNVDGHPAWPDFNAAMEEIAAGLPCTSAEGALAALDMLMEENGANAIDSAFLDGVVLSVRIFIEQATFRPGWYRLAHGGGRVWAYLDLRPETPAYVGNDYVAIADRPGAEPRMFLNPRAFAETAVRLPDDADCRRARPVRRSARWRYRPSSGVTARRRRA